MVIRCVPGETGSLNAVCLHFLLPIPWSSSGISISGLMMKGFMKLPRNLQRYLILPQGTFLKVKNIKVNYEKVGSTTDTADANGEYTNGNVANGVSPTIINAEMLNTFQRELVNVVEGAGIALEPNDDGQVLKALDKIIDDKFDCSISFNGYQKFASGLVRQWGRTSITTDSDGNF